jgi:hypothetical protein
MRFVVDTTNKHCIHDTQTGAMIFVHTLGEWGKDEKMTITYTQMLNQANVKKA